MAERISGTGVSSLSSPQDLHQAEIEQSKPVIQGALPASLAPLSTPEQFHTIGTGATGSSDALRLAPPGEFKSVHFQTVNLGQVLKRLQAPSEGHPFSNIEAKMGPILKDQHDNLQSILARLTIWKN